jgi:predicted DNA-binding transcriptional regulator AlpA
VITLKAAEFAQRSFSASICVQFQAKSGHASTKGKGAAAMARNAQDRPRDGNAYELLTVIEAAEFLRLTRSTLDHYRCEGRGPTYRKHGARVFYPKDELIAWSQRHAYVSTSQKYRHSR